VRAVFFDLDETLLDHTSAVRAGAAALARALGHPDPAKAVELWLALERHFFDRYLAGELSFLEQRRARVRGLAAEVGRELDDAEADAAFATYFSCYQASWTAFPDVESCVARLRTHADVRLGVVTNGDRVGQRAKLARLGLLDAMDVVVTADEVGCGKPDPRIFQEACERAGVPAEAAVMVGDRLDVDADGARAAGLLGVWLDRGGRDLIDVHDGSRLVRISSLTELPALVLDAGDQRTSGPGSSR
jgi:putative hydrolase of the HAD superfamily